MTHVYPGHRPEFYRYGSLPVGSHFRLLVNCAVWQKCDDGDRLRWAPEPSEWNKLHMLAPNEDPERLVIPVEVRT